MIEIRDKQILINGEPQIIMCGEIHYFRLQQKDWQDRIDKLKAAGCNAVASYVPWLCHEPVEGAIDLTGKTKPELDLGGFIDLCKENGLYFFVRPGPFIMAEMKNEGLPYWIYEKHPHIVPISWDGKEVPTKTVDYLSPGFLQEARRWFAAVMAVIEPRLITKGGNIIGVQLDNEIGMLSWVSNSPDLTDNVITDFFGWLQTRYPAQTLQSRYPIDWDNQEAREKELRSPREEYATALLCDLGYYMRNRFARYVAKLRSWAEESGVRDIPFVVNIHGSSAGRGLLFPIGISQLFEAYTQAPGYLSGSDLYFGDLTMGNFQDLYLINAFMDAVHLPDQPLTSVEFNCGDGNFDCSHGARYDPSAVDLKMRMCIAQGNRLLNYYLFAGGYNYRLHEKPHNGNDRIAFTGERHGFAAPISPEGELNYTYPRMAHSIQTMMAVSDKLAIMEEEHDEIAFAFIPDYFMTEYSYPGSDKMKEMVQNLEANRADGAWEMMARAILLAGYRFGAIDIQNRPINPETTRVLILPSARYMPVRIQQKLITYLQAGGRILLYGEVPLYDMEGNPCLLLADALGVKPRGYKYSSDRYYLSLCADGWAAPRPEVRTHFAQRLEVGKGAEVLFRLYDGGEVCGFDAAVGNGRAVVIAAQYNCDISLFQTILEKLGAVPTLTHDCPDHGIFMTSTAAPGVGRFLHILNLDGFDKRLHLYENGRALLGGQNLLLQSRSGVMLPLHLTFGDVMIVYSTAEIAAVEKDSIRFHLTQEEDVMVIETTRQVAASKDYTFCKNGSRYIVTSHKHAKIDDDINVRFYD
ncbi:beta-galactosidase [Desmospora activa]|uniref:Beta-galactosidase n=1 Tax=Desmospora activa DSM 45169 TaxID=1121389 RepID=A0A2T4ZCZ5_9BACL|nr:beta-galactosidase [Desmospora activa]PTM59732.1 beta-galactosidase [Desmospora activa DSM 45169]